MTTHQQRPTAKIYQFPKQQPATPASLRQSPKAAPQQSSAQIPTVGSSGSWYHQAALEEAEQECDLPHQQH